MDLVWDETLGEQIREASDRALQQQASEMRETARDFQRQATQREQQILRLEATLPIFKTVTFTHSDSDGNTFYKTEQVQDHAATAEIREQINQMKRESAQVRQAADVLLRAANELDDRSTMLNQKYREMQRMLQSTDQRYAQQIEQLSEKMRAFTAKMTALQESFDFVSLKAGTLGAMHSSGSRSGTGDAAMQDGNGGGVSDEYWFAYVRARIAIASVSDWDTANELSDALEILPPKHRAGIMDIVANAPPLYRGMFFGVIDQINIVEIDRPGGGGRFSMPRGTISFNADLDRDNFRGPYFTFFHEVGHLIDWVVQSEVALVNWFTLYTESRAVRQAFFDAISKDVENMLRDVAAGVRLTDPFPPLDPNLTIWERMEQERERERLLDRMRDSIVDRAIANIMSGDAVSLDLDEEFLPEQFADAFQFQLQQEMIRVLSGHTSNQHTWGNLYTIRDVFSGITNNALGLSNRPSSYWFTMFGNPTFHQNSEFFASHFAFSMLNDQQALSNQQSFMPNASDAMSGIVADMARIIDNRG